MEGVGSDGLKECEWPWCKKGINGKPKRFKPNLIKKEHKYCSATCRSAAGNLRTAGAAVIVEMRKEITAIKNRMAAFDEFVKKHTVKP